MIRPSRRTQGPFIESSLPSIIFDNVSFKSGKPEFDSRCRHGFFLSSARCPVALKLTKICTQWLLRVFYLGIRRPAHEAYHRPLSNGLVNNICLCTSRLSISQGISYPQVLRPKFCIPLFSFACYMSFQSGLPWFHGRNNTR